MKTNFLTLLSLTLLLSVSSCTIDINERTGDGETISTPGTTTGVLPEGGKLSGDITKDLTVKKGNYVLEGIVKVAD